MGVRLRRRAVVNRTRSFGHAASIPDAEEIYSQQHRHDTTHIGNLPKHHRDTHLKEVKLTKTQNSTLPLQRPQRPSNHDIL
jgi:Spy/CpxP family protein refolding chaperone